MNPIKIFASILLFVNFAYIIYFYNNRDTIYHTFIEKVVTISLHHKNLIYIMLTLYILNSLLIGFSAFRNKNVEHFGTKGLNEGCLHDSECKAGCHCDNNKCSGNYCD